MAPLFAYLQCRIHSLFASCATLFVPSSMSFSHIITFSLHKFLDRCELLQVIFIVARPLALALAPALALALVTN